MPQSPCRGAAWVTSPLVLAGSQPETTVTRGKVKKIGIVLCGVFAMTAIGALSFWLWWRLPAATRADVRYGPHEKQVLDFWRGDAPGPTPMVFYMHGGAWLNGDRWSELHGLLPELLGAGISVVSIEYRFIPEAAADGETPPVRGPMRDAARALQFVRNHAAEWNIDKERIAVSGASAGGCTSLWLALHADLADAASADPVSRESTRPWCAAVLRAQTTLDPELIRDWTPGNHYGPHAFGVTHDPARSMSQFEVFLADRQKLMPWIAEFSPDALVTGSAPPIYLIYTAPPELGREQADPVHSANFGVKFAEHLRAAGIEHELVYPGAKNVKHASMVAFLIEKLKAK